MEFLGYRRSDGRVAVSYTHLVLVLGAGTIGVLAAVAAKAKGARVYVADVAEKKLQFAMDSFGLEGTLLNDSPEHFREQVEAVTGGDGFDVTIEAVGLP